MRQLIVISSQCHQKFYTLTDGVLFLALIVESGDMIWEITMWKRKMFDTRKPSDLDIFHTCEVGLGLLNNDLRKLFKKDQRYMDIVG